MADSRVDPSSLTIDEPSAIWAWSLGRAAKASWPAGSSRVDWRRLCPFRPQTPHYMYFHKGWLGQIL